MPGIRTTNFVDSNGVDLGKKLVTKDYLLEVYGTILESSGATGLVVTPELWTFGRNQVGQLGNNATFDRPFPVTTFAGGTNWKQVAGGNDSAAAIKTDGSLWVWGLNDAGQLGTNDNITRSIPITTFSGSTDWKSVSCGYKHTAAIKTDGSLWTWGRNGEGQLGINNIDTRSIPVTTFAGGNTWKSVSAGSFHTAAIKTDGSLWTWGRNEAQLGDNTGTRRSTPVTTFAGGNTWKQVACGGFHTAAIKTDGSLWIWGVGSDGRLGNFVSGSNRVTPVTTFAGGNTWKQVAAGERHTAAIKTDGTLWTWGHNAQGPLGVNDTTDRSTPVTTFAGGTNWKQVFCGKLHTTAIKTDGSLWTWGNGGNGQLGNNGYATRSTPVTTFAGGNNWKQVSSGYSHITAIQSIDYI